MIVKSYDMRSAYHSGNHGDLDDCAWERIQNTDNEDLAVGEQTDNHNLLQQRRRISNRISGDTVIQNLVNKPAEVLVLGDKVGLAIQFEKHASFAIVAEPGCDSPFRSRPGRLFVRRRHTLFPEDDFRLFEIAVGLGECRLAIHHPGIRFVAELLDGFDRDHGSSW